MVGHDPPWTKIDERWITEKLRFCWCALGSLYAFLKRFSKRFFGENFWWARPLTQSSFSYRCFLGDRTSYRLFVSISFVEQLKTLICIDPNHWEK